jgi:hypothetical protein
VSQDEKPVSDEMTRAHLDASKWFERVGERPLSAVSAWANRASTTSPPVEIGTIVLGGPAHRDLIDYCAKAAKSAREDVADFGQRALDLDERQRRALEVGDSEGACSAAIQLGAHVAEWQSKDRGEPYYRAGELSAKQGPRGKEGGAPRLIDAPDRYAAVDERLDKLRLPNVADAVGAERHRLAKQVAERYGVKVESVLRAARRHRRRSGRE